MNKRIAIKLLAITAFIFSGFFTTAFADTSTSTELINAEILSNVWYSTTTINENDSIFIYAGFQNHSAKSLTVTAGFYVDDIQITKNNFSAGPKSLIKLETKYIAVKGEHVAQVKILSIDSSLNSAMKLSVDNLLAKETEKKNFSVKHEITKEEVIKTVGDVAVNTVNTIDNQTEKLATYVESLKEPASAKITSSLSDIPSIAKKTVGKVLGMSTENTDNTKEDVQQKSFSFYNMFLNIIAYIVRHWVWALVIIVLIVLYISFR